MVSNADRPRLREGRRQGSPAKQGHVLRELNLLVHLFLGVILIPEIVHRRRHSQQECPDQARAQPGLDSQKQAEPAQHDEGTDPITAACGSGIPLLAEYPVIISSFLKCLMPA